MIPLLILAALVAIPYAIYRACRKWGLQFLWFFAAGVGFLGASGVLAEKIGGPRWSWNFAHHDSKYAISALIQGVFFLGMGLRYRAGHFMPTSCTVGKDEPFQPPPNA